ncbi:hypothetical protein SAMN04515647_4427 [Cohaesibacter sp. ES.047]|uniref:hypothetical protein n=1 Tax=Cohaesibacter sp. ES.047 TaxID=1798205 RepID=UPI000BB8A749|nr:hypothetical protein [Cohaesibacter sp. ES.047]SNY94104.1 hypothetical protein SAMN04515647_4427 [Cohaesibacter sp. ES.047]
MTNEPPILRQFGQFMQSLEDGQFHQDCSDTLTEIREKLTDYMLDHGGEPSATLTIKFKLKMEKGTLSVRPSLDKSLPKAPRGTSMLYVTEKGLTPLNPKQMDMFRGKPKEVPDSSDVKTI